MGIFTARPERLLGNIALASLVAGIPAGLFLSLLGGALHFGELSLLDWLRGIGEGVLLGPVIIFVAGLALVAPLLAVLRHFGFGGPFFVFLLSVAISLIAMTDGLTAGIAGFTLSLAASVVFCRHAYPELAGHEL